MKKIVLTFAAIVLVFATSMLAADSEKELRPSPRADILRDMEDLQRQVYILEEQLAMCESK